MVDGALDPVSDGLRRDFSRLDRHVAVIHVLRLTGCSWFVQGGKTEMLRLLLNHVAGTHEAAAIGLKNPDTGLQSGLRL